MPGGIPPMRKLIVTGFGLMFRAAFCHV